jgi:Zn-dependent protease
MASFKSHLETPRGWLIIAAMIFLILMTNACHEGGHALAAWWGGDRRPSLRRRCTLNPINHFHWLLTLVMPLVALWLSAGQLMFGGARPVLINRNALGRVKMALAALAGPVGNFLCAGFLIAILGLCWEKEWLGIDRFDQVRSPAFEILKVAIWFSLFLGLLNLIPLPGLDGGHVVGMCLPTKIQRIWYLLTPIGILGLLAILLYYGGFMYRWGWVSELPADNPFIWLSHRVEGLTQHMKDWWGAHL